MKIKRYEGATEQEAIEKVKTELGMSAIIVSIKTVRPRGIFAVFKKPKVEVTAAYDASGQEGAQKQPSFKERVLGKSFKETPPEEVPSNEAAPNEVPEGEQGGLRNKTDFDYVAEDIRKDRRIMEQEQKIKLLEKNALTAQEMLSRMSQKLSVEQHKPVTIPGERKYANNIVQVFHDTLMSQGVLPQTADALLDGIDVDLTGAVDDPLVRELVKDEKIDINFFVRLVYNRIVSIIGESKPVTGIRPEQGSEPFVAVFIGPTGVGKTTTIAKLSADFAINQNLSVSLISADTYRIAAVEQLKTYADILGIDIGVVYNPDDMQEYVGIMKSYSNVVLIDTAGRSHKHSENMRELKELLDAVEGCHKFLVLSLTTKYEDMLDIVSEYSAISDFRIIFTKLDETLRLGSVLNLCHATGKNVSYITFGQNVPDDIRALYPEEIARAILCGV